MLDPRLLRNDLDKTAQALARRGYVLDTAAIATLEEQRKQVQVQTQQYQNERNVKSKAIGQAKARGEDASSIMQEVAAIGAALKQGEVDLERLQGELAAIALGIPNIPHVSVPDGKDENANQEIRRWGKPATLNFSPKDHVDLGEQLGLLDFDAAARISAARFSVL
ncbi:MAG: serine--tRNA ligase, partial [Gammaproteobacteria bacterium]|nr:serine--tRNA ligase [Gammaproteobacteria bacterium]